MKRLHIIISGRVQGVFYRDFAKREAEKLDLVGYVKNLENGQVEVIVQGKDENLEKFVGICKRGPLMAFVKNIDSKEIPPENNFENFDVRY